MVEGVVGKATECLGGWDFPGDIFPKLTLPGLPNFVLGTFAVCMPAINIVLDLIPPKLPKLKKLKIPTFDFFLGLFLGGILIPKLDFDLSGLFNLIFGLISMIFKFFLEIFLALLKFTVKIPTFAFALGIFLGICMDFGFSFNVDCIPKMFFDIISAFLPI